MSGALGDLRRRLTVPALFAAALALASVCHPEGASLAVHARLCVALAAFLLVGTALEAVLGLGGVFVFHRIMLGQIALWIWFYLRSLLSFAGMPGMGRIEIWLVVFLSLIAAAWHLRRKPPVTRTPWKIFDLLSLALVFLVWGAALHWFVGRYSGHLETPTSDPDLHAFVARLTAHAGRLVFHQAPYSDDYVSYPSGFSSLNAVWMLLGGTSAVAQVDAQTPLQGCLAVGLLLEAGAALRGKLRAAPALFLFGVGFVLVALPVHPGLDGTTRNTGTALLILPLTFALRARAIDPSSPALDERRLRALVLLVAASALIFAFALNPALLLASPPILLVALLVSGRALAAPVRAWALAFALAGLVIGSDAWVHSEWRNLQRARAVNASSTAGQPPISEGDRPAAASSKLLAAVERGLHAATADSALAIFPRGCQSSPQCREDLAPLRDWTPLAFAAALLLLLIRRRVLLTEPVLRSAALLVSLGAGLWLARFLTGAIAADPARALSIYQLLFHRYAREGLDATSVLLWLLAMEACLAMCAPVLERLLSQRGRRIDPDLLTTGIALAAVAILQLGDPALAEETTESIAANLGALPPSGLGPIEPIDLEFVEAISKLVPADERVLLPGLPVFNGLEAWEYAVGTSRAIPLYSNIDFAFFVGMGFGDFNAANYRRHVCRALDLNWLSQRRVRWLIVSPLLARDACVHELPYAATHDFSEAFRLGDRVLLHLRSDKLSEAAIDPLLGVPQREPLRSSTEINVASAPIGAALLRGPVAVRGWACDPASADPISVELELSNERGEIFHELHAAALEDRDDAAAQLRCAGSSTSHGFAFAPVTAPAGHYQARLFTWDAAGKTRVLLADDFSIQLDF